ncbi:MULTISPECIES: MSMEG_0567/Sll0786 family nitrogen starvation N-acetyltransferase [unclassified Hyphomicrobium]|uniref:MSMEG_0567/Sll0786 family nitrogen starvation N-acetyltransferase n=1 Tax=unclassified Hyphomicrobium TaxID=2619925 RepID=UPI000213D5F9|nr:MULTISPECIES: MSMEG_0567/Sll0786 family nitrogen starvation N-acetyltransferase [unclassified Hyphomicrobium]CCB66253.1 Acetyltransferase, gnat family [Hyphomicrobium sp. MC1]
MIEIEPRPYQCPGYFIRAASMPWEARGASDLRKRVFVEEQKIFKEHDRDDIDLIATHLVAISTYAHEADAVVGTVRIHQAEPGLWWGSRLVVDRNFRQVGRLGAELIRFAVSLANTRGCHTFHAHVQEQNVILFRRLNWRLLEMVELHGRPHGLMSANLAHYPPILNEAMGWYHKPRRIAA